MSMEISLKLLDVLRVGVPGRLTIQRVEVDENKNALT